MSRIRKSIGAILALAGIGAVPEAGGLTWSRHRDRLDSWQKAEDARRARRKRINRRHDEIAFESRRRNRSSK